MPCLGAELVQASPYGGVDALWQRGSGQPGDAAFDADAVLLAQPPEEFGEKEWVAAGLGGQHGEFLPGGHAQRVGGHLGHRVVVERLQEDPDGPLLFQQVEQPVGVIVARGGTAGQEPGHGTGRQPRGQGPQGHERGRIGPLEIVQGDEQRPGAGSLLQRGLNLFGQPEQQTGPLGKGEGVPGDGDGRR